MEMVEKRSLAAFVMSFAPLIGCGTAQYQERYDTTLKELRRMEPYTQLLEEPTEIPLTDADAKKKYAATMRIPEIFDSRAKRYEPGMKSDEPIDPERMLPPFIAKLPGFRFTYELFFGEPGSEQPGVYLTVCGARGKVDYERIINDAVLKAYEGFKRSDLKDGWVTEDCPTPKKKEEDLEWRRITLRLPEQQFGVKDPRNQIGKKELDGIVEAFVYSEGGKHVMFMLRAPESLDAELDLGALAQAAAGTLRWEDEEAEEE